MAFARLVIGLDSSRAGINQHRKSLQSSPKVYASSSFGVWYLRHLCHCDGLWANVDTTSYTWQKGFWVSQSPASFIICLQYGDNSGTSSATHC
jgi:hypothetical protein